MTVLIELKEKLKEFYGSCSGIVLPIVKFLLALAVFRGINSNLGYLKMLNSMYVVLILSLICAILPLNGMVFLAMLVIIGHCFALHMVIAGLAALVLLVLWFLYLRFVPKDAPALLLTPLAFWLHVPSAVPVAYGLAGTPLSAFSAVSTLTQPNFFFFFPEEWRLSGISSSSSYSFLITTSFIFLFSGIFQPDIVYNIVKKRAAVKCAVRFD